MPFRVNLHDEPLSVGYSLLCLGMKANLRFSRFLCCCKLTKFFFVFLYILDECINHSFHMPWANYNPRCHGTSRRHCHNEI